MSTTELEQKFGRVLNCFVRHLIKCLEKLKTTGVKNVEESENALQMFLIMVSGFGGAKTIELFSYHSYPYWQHVFDNDENFFKSEALIVVQNILGNSLLKDSTRDKISELICHPSISKVDKKRAFDLLRSGIVTCIQYLQIKGVESVMKDCKSWTRENWQQTLKVWNPIMV